MTRRRISLDQLVARHGLSIQRRLLLLAVAAALPTLIFSLQQARMASRIERQGAEQRALQLARRVATRVDDHVSTIDALLVALSRTVVMDPSATARNDSILAAVARDLGPGYLTLSVADERGRVVGLSGRRSGRIMPTVADRKYFQDALRSRGLGIGEPMMGRISNAPSLAYGRAILDPRGVPIGVVTASTLLGRLRSAFVPQDLPQGTVVTVYDERGTPIIGTGPPRSPPADGSRVHPAPLVGVPRDGVREMRGTDGIPRLTAAATATRVRWTAHVEVPSSVALARVNALEREAFLLFAFSLVVGVLLAWLLARGISGPVRALTADAEAFVTGSALRRSAVDAGGEIGTLATTFNRMIDTLDERAAELGASEIRYRALFETMPLPMWLYDRETLRFLAVNEAAISRYGYSRDEFLRLSVSDIQPAGEASTVRETSLPNEADRRHNVHTRHRTRRGEELEVEISSDDLMYGESAARLVVAIDVTLRRRTELALRASQEQLRQSQKMEAVGSLAGGIAHDFNNLLTAILGYSDLALDELGPDSGARADVTEIRLAALRAAELTHQLLAFSRQQVLQPRVFLLGPAVSPMERVLGRLISESIILDLDVDDETPAIRADPTQLEQVILNLVLNARDAMPRGGRLRVRTARTTLATPRTMSGTVLAAGSYGTLEVTDTGTGIAPEVRERLFEPFFTTKERGRGTGLGLATVYGIVQQSGGGIEVVSAPGEGTTFTIYFPEAAPPALDADSCFVPVRWVRQHAPAAPAGTTILLAEDDDAVRAIAREVLEHAGYRVLHAADGLGALAVADAHPGAIELLLTDVIMPGMNGRELAEALLARRPGLRVLFASGYSDNVLLDQGVLAPGTRLIDKPFSPALLVARIADVLEGAA